MKLTIRVKRIFRKMCFVSRNLFIPLADFAEFSRSVLVSVYFPTHNFCLLMHDLLYIYQLLYYKLRRYAVTTKYVELYLSKTL